MNALREISASLKASGSRKRPAPQESPSGRSESDASGSSPLPPRKKRRVTDKQEKYRIAARKFPNVSHSFQQRDQKNGDC